MFKKRTLSPQEIKQAERVRKAKDTLLEFQAPEGLFQKCNCCGKPVYNEDLIENDYVCPVCGNYFRIRPKTRIAMVLEDRKSTRLNSSHYQQSRMPSSA